MRYLVLTAILVATGTPLVGQGPDPGPEAEVRTVVESFHSALEAGDTAAALGSLHPEVVIYEGGHAETLSEYRSGHIRGDMAFAAATDRAVTDASVAVWGDQALYTGTSSTTGQYRGREIDSHGTETMVLVRTPSGWRIRHIHWSSR